MNPQNISMNQRIINDNNYKNINDHIINYKNNLDIDDDQNCSNNQNQNIIFSTKKILGLNENINNQYGLNNYQKIIQDLQYSNAFLNKKNLNLESELEYLKNKYNSSKNDIDDINKHIEICKENQDKIISDLMERNDYLENLILKKNKIDVKPEEVLNNKNNINLHLFIYKMKRIFNNGNFSKTKMDEKMEDEDYLNFIINNIIKMNDELIIFKKELEEKEFEIKKLKKENQLLKIKFQHIYNKNKLNNNLNCYNSSKSYVRIKTPVERRKLINLNNDNISNLDYKDNYSSYSYHQAKVPLFFGNYKTHSSSPLNNNFINNLSKTPNASDFKLHCYNSNIDNVPFAKSNNNEYLEKKLMNSHSIGNLKYKTLTDFENDKNNNKYQFPKATLVYQQCANSKNSLQSLMNNVAQLENVLKDAQNNIYENSIENNYRLS